MARVFITGSTAGLGRAAALALINEGHEVVLHARSRERAAALADVGSQAAGIAIGDLSSELATRDIARQVNSLGRMDAVIHNAAVYLEPVRGATPEGHARTLAINALAPYLLTALIERPDRLVYLSSGLHRAAGDDLHDIDWTQRRWNAGAAYSESKLYVTALAMALAQHWPDVRSNVVDPGWVPTRMGGPGAPDDLEQGHLTQAWLAAGDDEAARVSGGYWYHRRRRSPNPISLDEGFQDKLVSRLTELTGTALF